ncbi:MAG: SGNH/GDSL hydrolase family protein [Ruminococcaceae bacterium]|nr:SGNH/GDSL hydrolase family protein [Oscillospiraceae bacterium]
MKITEKINMDYDALVEHGPITIVAFGDSVTHGALSSGEFNYETVYWNLLKRKILNVRNYVPVNVINAGIGGITAKRSLGRLDSQVITYHPDLVIVCFGLNDVNGSLEDYLSSLETIFTKCIDSGAEVVFMTPNMLNTYVADDTDEALKHYAKVTAEMQNGGKMDKYMSGAVDIAFKCGVKVCDCYSAWKKMSQKTDTTMLLINRINHPNAKMHELFADMLFDTIFADNSLRARNVDSAMYEEK